MHKLDRNVVEIEAWKQFHWLWHGFSTRQGGVSAVYRANGLPGGSTVQETDVGGDLNLGWTKEDDAANVIENRRRFGAAITALEDRSVPLITVRQVHGAESLVVPGSLDDAAMMFLDGQGRAVREGDGLVTDAAGVLLAIQTADCVPVLVADTRQRVVGCFHAGWRGTVARIVERGIARMQDVYDSSPQDLMAAIGPSIGPCCYSVGDEVHETFAKAFRYSEMLFRQGKSNGSEATRPASDLLYLDLWKANYRQLEEAGLSAARIATVGECTGCAGSAAQRRYFSYRRENGITGRMLSVIGIAEYPPR